MQQNNMRILYLPLILINLMLLLNITGCKKEPVNDNNVEEPEFLVPLEVGNYWEYVDYTFSGDEIIEGLTDSIRMEITDEMTMNYEGEVYTAAVRSIFYPVWNDEADPIKWLFWNGENGVYLLGGISPTDMFISKIFRYKYPADVGEEWQWYRLACRYVDLKFTLSDTLTITCVGKNEPFETRAGTFKCYVYNYQRLPAEDVSEKWDYYLYYAPGIGKVGSIIRSTLDNSIKFRRILIRYYVKSINLFLNLFTSFQKFIISIFFASLY